MQEIWKECETLAVIITIIGFGIMVLLHEMGHFLTAKKFGVLVHEFSIGMGPKLFSVKKGETAYSLRALPIGGYVKLEGENDTEENTSPRAFSNIAPIKRIIVLFAGAAMNIVLGWIIFVIINLNMGVSPSVVREITPEMSKFQNVLSAGDEIVCLNSTRTHTFDDVSLFMSRCDGSDIKITYKHNNSIKTKSFTPIKTDSGYKLGVMFLSEKAGIGKSAVYGVYDTMYIAKAVFFALGDLFTGREGLDTLSGPVEIVSVVGTVTKNSSGYTLISILYLFAMITVNLGIFNLLPFPALDGGSIIFAFYELVTKKKVKPELVGYAGMIGFALLMLLAAYVTVGDIKGLFK